MPLSKTQIVLCTVGICLLIALSIPRAKIWFSGVQEKIHKPYISWDPDNTQSLKDKIAELNKEGLRQNSDLKFMEGYLEDIKGIGTGWMKPEAPPSDREMLRERLESIQPNTLFGPISDNTPGMTEEGLQSVSINLLKHFANIGKGYTLRYQDFIKRMGFSPVTTYSFGPPSAYITRDVMTNNPIRLVDSVRNVDTSAKTIANVWKASISDLSVSIDSFRANLSSHIQATRATIDQLNKDLKDAEDTYAKDNLSIDKDAVWIGIPLFIVATLLMYIFGSYNNNRLREDLKSSSSFNSEDYKTGLNFTLFSITVLLLILTLIILGLANILKDNSLSALLGMIAGYILNTSATAKAQQTPVTQPAPEGAKFPMDEIRKLNESKKNNTITDADYDSKLRGLVEKY